MVVMAGVHVMSGVHVVLLMVALRVSCVGSVMSSSSFFFVTTIVDSLIAAINGDIAQATALLDTPEAVELRRDALFA